MTAKPSTSLGMWKMSRARSGRSPLPLRLFRKTMSASKPKRTTAAAAAHAYGWRFGPATNSPGENVLPESCTTGCGSGVRFMSV